MGTHVWGPDVAEAYDSIEETTPEKLAPMLDALAELSNGGRALELAVGTGRVALPLAARGVEVHGIELSPHMASQLARKPGAEAVNVTLGDMCTAKADGTFQLVYLIYNTIMNVTTQDEQVEVFENAAAHLDPGGTFVVEVLVPQLQRVPRGQRGHIFAMEKTHVAIETFDSVIDQIAWSHHWIQAGDRLLYESAPYRYVWPAELDLMARIAGLRLRDRWSSWDRTPYADGSVDHIAVYEKG